MQPHAGSLSHALMANTVQQEDPTTQVSAVPIYEAPYSDTLWSISRSFGSVEVEEGHDLPEVFRLLARLEQQVRVVEGEADHLLHPVQDVPVADPANQVDASGH